MSEQKEKTIREIFKAINKEIGIDELAKHCFGKRSWACEVLLDYMIANPKPDQIKGGLGDNADIKKLDRIQLIKGVEVELEHTNDPYVSLEIAKDHLTEHKRYYIPYLENAEREMEKHEK